jgi:glycosyltransferase involved in cell wall biosynthesis
VFLAVADLSNVGNPLLEAMTCGLPIVAVDAGDTRSLIHDGETGRLLASGAPAAISRAAIELANEPPLRQRLGAGARRHAETHFWSWEARLNAEMEEVEQLDGKRVVPSVAEPARRAG